MGRKIEINTTYAIIIGHMEFNRLVSLVLGFIVLILIFVWVGSRFRSATREKTASIKISITPTPTKTQKNNWNPLGFLFNNATKTPTPKVTGKTTPKTITIQVTKIIVKNGQNKSITYLPTQTTQAQVEYRNNKTGIKQIPSTGAATIAIPLAFSALSLGVYLRRKV